MASLAAIGLCLHSGWASTVLMAQESGKGLPPRLVARRRMVLCSLPHSKQPYHAAENMELAEARAFIADCRASTIALAMEALQLLSAEIGARELAGAGLAASSARTMPELSAVLHSHRLIHAAEGVFYREAMREAAGKLGIKARALTKRAAGDFLVSDRGLREVLDCIGKAAGPPWTMDEKCASLAAFSLLPDLAGKFHLEILADAAG